MSELPPWVKKIDAEAGTKVVLAVEGDDDKLVVEKWLGIRAGGVCQKIHVAACGGASRVRVALNAQDTWWGLCDSDDWTDKEKVQAKVDTPRLRFLPRYCLESFFIVPDELWELLPPPQQNKYTGGKDAFKRAVTIEVDPFVRHWCMWIVLRVRRRELLASFPHALLDRVLEQAVLSEREISTQLKQWHNRLRPEDVYQAYTTLLIDTKRHKTSAKLRHHVHGKEFFRRVVCGKVLQKLDGQNHSKWLEDLATGIKAVPSELDGILSEFLA
jgi:hypothetical protein